MSAEPMTLRKVSILLGCLDEVTVAKILTTFPAEEAANLRRAVRQAHAISPQERQAVLREFMDLDRETEDDPAASDPVPGIEIDASLAELLAESGPKPIMPGANEEDSAWGFLRRLSRTQLARRLERESPQVAAVILAQIPPQHAASVLHAMPRDTRLGIIQRLTRLENQDPMILDAIRIVLEKEFPDQVPLPTKVHPPGWETARAIMEASNPSVRKELTQHLAEAQGGAPLPTDAPNPATDVPLQPRSGWIPPWLQLFSEQPNPWHFD